MLSHAGITSVINETPTLYHLLFDICDQWYEIGQLLQVDYNVLDDLKQSQDNDKNKLIKVIEIWERTQPSPVTRETVNTVVESLIARMHQKRKLSKLLLLSNDVASYQGFRERKENLVTTAWACA